MVTGYEVGMYADLHSIADALRRIANCMEAQEMRIREAEDARRGTAASSNRG